jgi:hypothetical protein
MSSTNTNIPTEERSFPFTNNPDIEVSVPDHPGDLPNHLHMDDDSVSTFHPTETASIFTRASNVFHPRAIPTPSTASASTTYSVHRAPTEDDSFISKLSDAASRISDLESNFLELSDRMKRALKEFRQETRRNSKEQLHTQTTLTSTLEMLQQHSLHGGVPTLTDQANHPKSISPGGDLSSTWQGS